MSEDERLARLIHAEHHKRTGIASSHPWLRMSAGMRAEWLAIALAVLAAGYVPPTKAEPAGDGK